jgi:hypothetical protein
MPAMSDLRDQAVTGVAAPQLYEAIIRDVWPSVAASPGAATFARACYRSMIFAPLGWLVLAPVYFKKLLAVAPGMQGLAVRYRLTNRRLMICKGFRPVVEKEVPLDRIKDVKLVTDGNSEFFGSGTLDVIDATGAVILSLPGVAEAESVRHSILQSATAWGPVLRTGQPARPTADRSEASGPAA